MCARVFAVPQACRAAVVRSSGRPLVDCLAAPGALYVTARKRGRRPESFRHGLNTQGHLHSALVKIVKFTWTNRGPYTMGALV